MKRAGYHVAIEGVFTLIMAVVSISKEVSNARDGPILFSF
jgi:hypothetical protein